VVSFIVYTILDFFWGEGRLWVDWAACFWLILVHLGCSCSLSNSIRHHNSSDSAVMAQFRLLVVKAFVVMAFGCEDCKIACFDSKKNTAKTVCISTRLPWLSCIGEGWIEAGKQFECSLEHASRLVHMRVHPGARALEIGIRYSQATCQLSTSLGLTGTMAPTMRLVLSWFQ